MKKSSKLAAVLIAGGVLLNAQQTVKATSKIPQIDLKDSKNSLNQLQEKLVEVTDRLEKAEQDLIKFQDKKKYDQGKLDKALREQSNAQKQFDEAKKRLESAQKIYEEAKKKSGDTERIKELEQKKIEYETLHENAGVWDKNIGRYILEHSEAFQQLNLVRDYLNNLDSSIESYTKKLEKIDQKLRKLSVNDINYLKVLEEKNKCIEELEDTVKKRKNRQAELDKIKLTTDELQNIRDKAHNLERQWKSVKNDYEKVVLELEKIKKGEAISQKIIDDFEKEKKNFAEAEDFLNKNVTLVNQIEKQIKTDKEDIDRSVENKNHLIKEKELLLKRIQEQKQENKFSSKNQKDEGIQIKPEISEENIQTDIFENLDGETQTDNKTVDDGVQTDLIMPDKPETTEGSSQTDLIISNKSETSESSTQTDTFNNKDSSTQTSNKKTINSATQTELTVTDDFWILDKILKNKHQFNQPSYIEIPVYLPVENNSKGSKKIELNAKPKYEYIKNKKINAVKHKTVVLKFNKKHILIKKNKKWSPISQIRLLQLLKDSSHKYKLHGVVKINNRKKNIYFYDKNGKKLTKNVKSHKYLLREIKVIKGKLMVRIGSQKQWILAKYLLDK